MIDPDLRRPLLNHRVIDGQVANLFVRAPEVMAHALLSDGEFPRLVIAFAAGNSGVGLWFERSELPVHWQAQGELTPQQLADTQGRPLHGVCLELSADTPRLILRQALLGSVRVLRDHQFDGRLPSAGVVAPVVNPEGLVWARDRLDGRPGYRLDLQILGGRVETLHDGRIALIAAPGRPLNLRLSAFSGETPLTPLPEAELLNDRAADLPGARAALLTLAYREKWLAGSWRFLTYFGRDTLMSLRMLMPALQPAAAEAALTAVLERLSPRGQVAHEEDIGEFPLLVRLQHGEPADAAPIYDYKMVDDDFMLPTVAAAWLLESAAGRAGAAAFLLSPCAGSSCGELLLRNASFVLARARPFAQEPKSTNLVALGQGEIVGDWRDSADGLAGGRYSYSVNAVLVGAALRAVAALHAAGLLPDPSLAEATAFAEVWEREGPRCFDIEHADAAARIRAYSADLPSAARDKALQSLADAPLAFSALALDAAGQPLPILHSDFGFALLLGRPEPARIERELAALMRPYPAGLMTGAGLLVANAAQAAPSYHAMFGRDRYHGAVVWSWQQAMFVAGLARQLERSDLPESTRAAVRAAQAALWRVIEATRETAEGELWSWSVDEQAGYLPQPFGPLSTTADESNAAQLWSTVYLAVKPPAA